MRTLLFLIGVPLAIGVAGKILLGGNLAEGFCWMMVIFVGYSPLVAVLWCVYRVGRWLYNRVEIIDTPAAPAARPRPALRLQDVMSALLQYIEDCAGSGMSEEEIMSALGKKGWPPEQIETAFRTYRETLEKYKSQPA